MIYCCHYYWLIAPLRAGIEDSPERKPAFTLNVQAPDEKIHEIALYCDIHGQPEFARFTIPDLVSETIPESVYPMLQSIKEHLLSALRLTFRLDAMLAMPESVWVFVADGAHRQVNMSIQEFSDTTYDPEATKNVFALTFKIRELIRLYIDGVDTRIPLQYRFLSFYKVLENRFRKKSRWDHDALAAILQPHASNFSKLGFQKPPASVLHDLRDRCAHIRTGKDILGVTHLNLKAASHIEIVLPYLRAICAGIVNEQTDGQFFLSTEVIHDGLRPTQEL